MTEIVADSMIMLDSKGSAENGPAQPAGEFKTPATAAEEDLPF